MRQIAEFVSLLACALFTGAAVYVNLVEHPARMECGVELAATEFPPSYRRGTIMQATLAALGLPGVSSRMAYRGDILVARWRDHARCRDPIHAVCDPAHQ
jgi:hypothetical protein